MPDKLLYANDIIHRFASHTFTETTVNSETLVEFKNAGSTLIARSQKLSIIDAYRSIRSDLLSGETVLFLSTTTERDALTGINTGTIIDNITVGRNEIFNGTSWEPVQKRSVTTGITASTTQTQGNGALTSDLNVISTVANINDTVTLKTAIVGVICIVVNNGSKKMKIFPAAADDLGAGLNASITLSAGSTIIFHCLDATNWVST